MRPSSRLVSATLPRNSVGGVTPDRSREVAVASSGRTHVVDVFPASPPDDCSLEEGRNLPDELADSR